MTQFTDYFNLSYCPNCNELLTLVTYKEVIYSSSCRKCHLSIYKILKEISLIVRFIKEKEYIRAAWRPNDLSIIIYYTKLDEFNFALIKRLISLPYFEPNLFNLDKLKNKINTYLLLS